MFAKYSRCAVASTTNNCLISILVVIVITISKQTDPYTVIRQSLLLNFLLLAMFSELAFLGLIHKFERWSDNLPSVSFSPTLYVKCKRLNLLEPLWKFVRIKGQINVVFYEIFLRPQLLCIEDSILENARHPICIQSFHVGPPSSQWPRFYATMVGRTTLIFLHYIWRLAW